MKFLQTNQKLWTFRSPYGNLNPSASNIPEHFPSQPLHRPPLLAKHRAWESFRAKSRRLADGSRRIATASVRRRRAEQQIARRRAAKNQFPGLHAGAGRHECFRAAFPPSGPESDYTRLCETFPFYFHLRRAFRPSRPDVRWVATETELLGKLTSDLRRAGLVAKMLQTVGDFDLNWWWLLRIVEEKFELVRVKFRNTLTDFLGILHMSLYRIQVAYQLKCNSKYTNLVVYHPNYFLKTDGRFGLFNN